MGRDQITPAGTERKYHEWFRRYSLPEFAGLLGAYGAILLYKYFFSSSNQIIASFLGTWAENVGYYSVIIYRDLKKINKENAAGSAVSKIIKITRGLFVEFGFSETLDSFVVRPLCLFYAMHFFGVTFGIIIGKITADVVFYVATILCYELKKKHNL